MRIVATLVLSVLASAPALSHAAETWPQRPLRLVVPVPPGGASDFTARILGAKLGELLGQQIVVENRGGAAGTIASDLVAQATPDGHTLLFSSSTTHGIAPSVYRKLPYDPMKSFTHIALVNTIPAVMVVHQSVPAKTVKEFVALAKQKPLLFGSSGAGSPPHLLGELFKMKTGAPLTHVPYKGSGPAVIELAGGQLHAMFDGLPSLLGNIKAGKLRPLAAASAKRSTVLPDLPTMAEAGYPGVEGGLWFGISGPAGVPPAISDTLSKAVFTAVAQDDVKERFASVGGFSSPLGPKDYTEYIRKDIAKWAPVVKAAGATVD
ncbi:MAG TPA: tripartite tricarboxylate transporter substrate binding protein [Burkholderiales bacterium]|nr:tripartite tricarboxylate transporter substrate binding protein [Burkholderiales bacterium]